MALSSHQFDQPGELLFPFRGEADLMAGQADGALVFS